MPQINIDSDLLVAQRLSDGCGYTWTLASRLGEMLHMAEELFGPRDCSYTILGIEFGPDNPKFGILEIADISLSNLIYQLRQTYCRHAIKWLMKQSIYLHRVVDGTPTILKRELLATLLLTT